MKGDLRGEGGGTVLEVPLSIFSPSLSSLEAITKFLKEDCSLTYSQIALLLNRDARTIWGTYARIKDREVEKVATSSTIRIPLSVLSNRSLGVLEAISLHLRENHQLRYAQIAQLLHRDDRTIWTACARARRKVNG